MYSYFNNFIIDNFIISFIIIFILVTKFILKKQISDKCQYSLYFFILLSLIIPFLPKALFNLKNVNLNFMSTSSNLQTIYNGQAIEIGTELNWINDFALSVNVTFPISLSRILMILWILTIIILNVFAVLCICNIYSVLKKSQYIKNKEIISIFNECKDTVELQYDVKLLSSKYTNTPFTFGLFKIYIVIPDTVLEHLSYNDIKYIFLHELTHCKNNDIVINYILLIFNNIYWFNPIVKIALKKIKQDREILCDLSVLKKIKRENYIDYGNTIIHFANSISKNSYITSNISDSKKQIKLRVEKIASFSNVTKKIRVKSILFFILLTIVIFMQMSFVFAYSPFGFEDKYEFRNENVKYEDLSSYFDNLDGCFVLYDTKSNLYNIYNKRKSIIRVSPNSTYKIYSALFALESNVIEPQNTDLKWNKIIYPFDLWNQDQNLQSAMQNSVNWYFNYIDEKVGIEKLRDYFEYINYGNYNVSGNIESYWMESFYLKISPIEQVEVLKNFYSNEFDFKEENIEAVKASLMVLKNENYTVYGKTGTGKINNKVASGSFVGFVETKDNIYFFAVNTSSSNDNSNVSGSISAQIALSILKNKGII